jgi:hypothetical protein
MIRTTLPALLLSLAAAACENERPPFVPAGPQYTPATADALKAHAPDCEIKPGENGGETRACRGRQATMRIELDRERRLRELDMTVLASTGVWEAWTLFNNVLPAVSGQPVVDAARKKLRGDPADDVVDGVRVATAIDGQRYTVKLTWGR